MSGTEQRRARILTKLLVGEVTVAEAAALLELSQRQVWPLKVRFEREGPAGLVHANRGRASPRRLAEPLRARIVELARGRHAGVNDSHRPNCWPSTRRSSSASPPCAACCVVPAWPARVVVDVRGSRRDRMPQAGLLL